MENGSTRFWFTVWLILMGTLVSCGEEGLFAASTPTPPLTLVTPTTVPLPPEASTAARIRAQGYVRVGVRYDDAPFGIVTDEGDLVGLDVDLAREVARRWLGDPGAMRFVQVTDATVAERVRTGQVDLVIGALTRHRGDAQDLDYGAPYYYDGLSLAVRSAESITDAVIINGPLDLDGVVTGVVEEGDTEAPLLRAAGGAVPQIVTYPDYFAAMAGLESGVVQAVVGPHRTLARLSAGSSGLSLTPRFTRDAYAIGLPKNEGAMRDLVNVTLMELINDGTFQALVAQWFPDETVPPLEVWTGTSRLGFAGLSDTLTPTPNTIGAIEARGSLTVGMLDDRLPFSDFDADAVARGFEAELARAFAGRWLGDVAAVQFVRHSEESGIAALQAGQIDLLAAHMPHTLPRDDDIDFSQAIYEEGIGFLVSAASGVIDLSGLNGGTIAVPMDGITADVVQNGAARAGVVVAVQAVTDNGAALTGVAEGRYLAYAGWRSELLNLAFLNSGFLVLDARLTTRPIALGLRQNDSAFRDLVNFTLQALAAEGRFAAIYDDWFGSDPAFPVEIWLGAPYLPLKLTRQPATAPTPAP